MPQKPFWYNGSSRPLQVFLATLAIPAIVIPTTVANTHGNKRSDTASFPTVIVVSDPLPVEEGAAEAAYIRVAYMNDGSLMAGYSTLPVDSPDTRALRLARSTDVGASWQLVGEVARASNQTTDLDNASVLQLSSGRILYAYRRRDRTGHDPKVHLFDPKFQYIYFRLQVSYSNDGGKT